ncbi:hypothetical protein CHU98_g4730 [Xylaria longipes]|nr:hypothetical protein CHU98_g4730 [Xylaria longipes]
MMQFDGPLFVAKLAFPTSLATSNTADIAFQRESLATWYLQFNPPTNLTRRLPAPRTSIVTTGEAKEKGEDPEKRRWRLQLGNSLKSQQTA